MMEQTDNDFSAQFVVPDASTLPSIGKTSVEQITDLVAVTANKKRNNRLYHSVQLSKFYSPYTPANKESPLNHSLQ